MLFSIVIKLSNCSPYDAFNGADMHLQFKKREKELNGPGKNKYLLRRNTQTVIYKLAVP